MADAVTTQIIENGPRNLIMKFTNVSDGTGETNVVKVDASSFLNSQNQAVNAPGNVLTGKHLKIRRIVYVVVGGAVQVLWVATAPVVAAYLTGWGHMNLKDTQGMFNDPYNSNPIAAGVNGDIAFTTAGFNAAGDGPPKTPPAGYTIVLEMIKGE